VGVGGVLQQTSDKEMLEPYPYRGDPRSGVYYFESTGRKGVLQKRVTIHVIQSEGVRLLQVDLWEKEKFPGGPDRGTYTARSANGDHERVIVTLLDIVRYHALNHARGEEILLRGYDETRIRLYRIFFIKYYESILKHFDGFHISVLDDQFEELNLDYLHKAVAYIVSLQK